MIDVLVEWFDRRGRTTTVILRQRDKHPAHARGFLPSPIVDVLASMDGLLLSGQRPVDLAIPHSGLIRTDQKIMIGDIQKQSLCAAPSVKLCDRLPLIPSRIVEALMPRMQLALAWIAGVRAVVFQQSKTAVAMEFIEPCKVLVSP